MTIEIHTNHLFSESQKTAASNHKPNTLDLFKSDLRPMEYWANQADHLLSHIENQGFLGYKTGLSTIDTHMLLRPGELTVLAAQSSMGKTALGMQMVEGIANQLEHNGDSGVVAVFSAEMPGESLLIRMGCKIAGVSMHDVTMGKATAESIQAVRRAVAHIQHSRIWIDDNSAPTTNQMLEQLTRMMETVPVRALLFDFMELAGDDARTETERVGKIAHHLKAIAKTCHVPVVALSQLNDDPNKRANKMPYMSDLRNSKQVGQLADNVLLIMRPQYYFRKGEIVEGYDEIADMHTAVLNLDKHRNGQTAILKCVYHADKMTFYPSEKVKVGP